MKQKQTKTLATCFDENQIKSLKNANIMFKKIIELPKTNQSRKRLAPTSKENDVSNNISDTSNSLCTCGKRGIHTCNIYSPRTKPNRQCTCDKDGRTNSDIVQSEDKISDTQTQDWKDMDYCKDYCRHNSCISIRNAWIGYKEGIAEGRRLERKRILKIIKDLNYNICMGGVSDFNRGGVACIERLLQEINKEDKP